MRGQIVAVREHEPVVFEHWVGGTHMHPRRQALDDPSAGATENSSRSVNLRAARSRRSSAACTTKWWSWLPVTQMTVIPGQFSESPEKNASEAPIDTDMS